MIGIDPGTNTGIAVCDNQRIRYLESIHHNYAFERVEMHLSMNADRCITVVIEDASKRKWYGKQSDAKSQGAGAIKFCLSLWKKWASQFDDHEKISIDFIHPIIGGTKWNDETFKVYTGWENRTNDHMRDAGVIAMYYPSKRIKVPKMFTVKV